MEHEKPESFTVTPPVNNQNLEFRAECIKWVEPYARAHAQALEDAKFNNLVSSGSLNDIISGDIDKINEVLDKTYGANKNGK
jgi:hypothetical protein